jgi:protein transport protein SEC61 subunit alpha
MAWLLQGLLAVWGLVTKLTCHPTHPSILPPPSPPSPLPPKQKAVGQLTYLRPYVTDFSPEWLAGSTLALVAGAMSLVYIADTISELKLGNGTSVLIFAGIASSLPASVGALLAQNASDDPGNVAVYAVAFFLTTLGIIYVQEAERRIPINYSSRYQAGALARQSYLPFKVNATGVMPLIFASSLLGLPLALARYTDSTALDGVASAVGPGGALYLPASVALIAFFNYYYTFLQVGWCLFWGCGAAAAACCWAL